MIKILSSKGIHYWDGDEYAITLWQTTIFNDNFWKLKMTSDSQQSKVADSGPATTLCRVQNAHNIGHDCAGHELKLTISL